MTTHNTLHTFKTLLLALVLAFGLQYASAAWQGPTANPPGNNAAAPINVSDVSQEKDGALYVWAGGVFSGNGVWANKYCDLNGENCSEPPFGGGFATKADVEAEKLRIYNGHNNGNGTETMVDITNASGYLQGGHIQGHQIAWARVYVDGTRIDIPYRFTEDEGNRDDNSFVSLPYLRFESSLKVEYNANFSGDIVGGQAFVKLD